MLIVSISKKKNSNLGRPPKPKEPKKGITIYLTIPLSEKLDEVSRKNNRSKAQEIIHALKTIYMPEEKHE
ncbi:hypothetical protein BES34_020085 [Leptospira inadai serovar Lyme]|uniref:Ribbon-helix-helix protein, CopG family n=1 Tax=Leptospira inadai serovar Lyme TaxID=293084 RepID=A0ABX4YDA3_9LEPT|nr:hypothetical protein BES34_020085 [Leptospira inadai serovar Lyme]